MSRTLQARATHQDSFRLIRKNGIHATGTETIVEHSGIPPSMRISAQKEELVLAVLRQYDGLARNEFMRRAEGGGKRARTRLLAFFDFTER